MHQEANSSLTQASKKSATGFSLIELLVVLAVIGILVALLLPSLARSKQKAQSIQCIGNLHQQGVAMRTFISEYNCYPTWITPSNSDLPGRWWAVQIEHGGYGISNPQKDFYTTGVWQCPSATHRDRQVQGNPFYGYNVFGVLPIGNLYTNFGLGGFFPDQSSRAWEPIADSQVVAPANMMAIADSDAFAFMRAVDYDFYHHFLRHQNKVNAVFCDTHVESPTLQTLFEDTNDAALAHWNYDNQPHREKL